MAKMITVSMAELCAAVKDTHNAEDCAAAMHAYKAVKLGTVAEEEAARREARAQADARVAATHAANVEANMPIIGMFDSLHNALEEVVDEYNESDACSDVEETFSKKIGSFNISITEVAEGFMVDVNGKSMITPDLSGKSLMCLTRAMLH